MHTTRAESFPCSPKVKRIVKIHERIVFHQHLLMVANFHNAAQHTISRVLVTQINPCSIHA